MPETPQQRHERYLQNKEKERELNKQWQQNNRERRTEYYRKYRQTKNGKLAVQKAIKKYESSHPERKNAWNKAQKLLKKPCVICGKDSHRHHPDPHKPLEIIFLCPLHHKEQHRML